jgi:TolB protein
MKVASVSAFRSAFTGLAGPVAVFAALAQAPDAHSAFPGHNGRIAFARCLHGCQILSTKPGGSGARELAPNDSREPAFSADGRWIAFQRVRHHNFDIYKMRVDGSHEVRLTRTRLKDEWDPAFSPSGRTIVFHRQGGIWRMRANGRHPRRLVRHGGSPTYSPSGNHIVFTRHFDLMTMRKDGTEVRKITDTEQAYESRPDFAPTGHRLVFVRSGAARGDTELFTVKLDGSHLRRLTRNKLNDEYPVFSPNGRWIAFAAEHGSGRGAHDQDIYRIRADGSDRRRVTGTPDAPEIDPTWGACP